MYTYEFPAHVLVCGVTINPRPSRNVPDINAWKAACGLNSDAEVSAVVQKLSRGREGVYSIAEVLRSRFIYADTHCTILWRSYATWCTNRPPCIICAPTFTRGNLHTCADTYKFSHVGLVESIEQGEVRANISKFALYYFMIL